jgi:hypothetical protein
MVVTRRSIATLVLVALTGCAGMGGGLGSMQKTAYLYGGMTPGQVVGLLGPPAGSAFVDDELVWKYTLHQMGRGFVPYNLHFDARTQQLTRWYADEAEYQRQQASWAQALQQIAPPRQPPPPSGPPPAADPPPAARKVDPAKECEKKYRFIEDAMCECHNLCGVLPSFPP